MNFDSALAGGGIFMIVSNMFNEDLNKILLFSSEQLLDFFFSPYERFLHTQGKVKA